MAQLDFGLLNTNAPAQIAGAYGQGQQEARANLLAEQQLQHVQNQNALAKYQVEAARMQNEQQNALNAKYATPGFDPMSNPEHFKQLYGMGPTGRTQAGEILKYRADQRKEEESAFNIASKRHEVFKQEMGALATEPNLTKDTVAATLDKLVTGGLFSPNARDTIVSNLPDDPAKLRASIMQDAKSNLKGKDQLTAFLPEVMVAGGNLINKNPLAPGGAGAVVAPVAMTGFEAARLPIMQQQANAATANANIAGGNLNVNQQRAAIAQQELDQKMAGGQLKPVPVHAQKAITGAAASIGQLSDAIDLLKGLEVSGQKGSKSATGLKAYAPDIALNRLDPAGTVTRAAIADIGSMIMHDRSGAAVTVSESPRLKPFIPLTTDDAATALKKLERLRKIQLDDSEALTSTYNPEQGFKSFKAPIRGGAGKPAVPTIAPPSGFTPD